MTSRFGKISLGQKFQRAQERSLQAAETVYSVLGLVPASPVRVRTFLQLLRLRVDRIPTRTTVKMKFFHFGVTLVYCILTQTAPALQHRWRRFNGAHQIVSQKFFVPTSVSNMRKNHHWIPVRSIWSIKKIFPLGPDSLELKRSAR
jgi:hypothetical protein